MKIFNVKSILVLLLIAMTITSCSVASVDADEELVFVKKPIFFGKGGVEKEPLTSGSEWRWFSTDEVKFKVSPTQYEEKFQDIFTADNTPIDLSANILLQIKKGETPVLLEGFGEDWYKNNI